MKRAVWVPKPFPLPETDKTVMRLPVIVFFVACAIELLAIYILNDGHFVYTLDDPYIHLALAENIVKGHYGVNPGEYSSPSSSIIWPLLLVPFSALSIDQYVPLIINLLLSLAILLLFGRIVIIALRPSHNRQKLLVTRLIIVLLIPSTNLIGLAFTGMEHTLQLLLAVLVVFGVICEQERATVPRWLPAAIVCGPLVRYENLAVSLPALAYLLWRRQYRVVAICTSALVVVLASFSLFLSWIGLGLLPTSVLAKSRLAWSGGGLQSVLWNIRHNLAYSQGALLCLGLLLLVVPVFRSQQSRAHRVWAACVALAAALHLSVGDFGWFSRYEIYIWSTVLLTLIYLYKDSLVRIMGTKPKTFVLFVCMFVTGVCFPYTAALFTTPVASSNIYEQQYQMHRFVTEYYRAPVAVNDLGWVSYRNDLYVLDLWGLASREALDFRRTAAEPSWMNRLANEHNVKLAMIYDQWFPRIPANWIPIGQLHLGKPRITSASSIVTFYALDDETFSRVRSLLQNYQRTLPENVKFTFGTERTTPPMS